MALPPGAENNSKAAGESGEYLSITNRISHVLKKVDILICERQAPAQLHRSRSAPSLADATYNRLSHTILAPLFTIRAASLEAEIYVAAGRSRGSRNHGELAAEATFDVSRFVALVLDRPGIDTQG